MTRTTSRARRPTRFDQITPEQENAFSGETAELFLTGKFRSFRGKSSLRKFFELALKGFQTDVQDFEDAIALTDAFVLMCNSNQLASNRAFEQIRSLLRTGVLAYAKARGLHRARLNVWPIDLGAQMVRFLRRESLNRAGKPIRRHAQICVGRSGIAIHAAVLTALIRVDALLKADVGRVVVAQD